MCLHSLSHGMSMAIALATRLLGGHVGMQRHAPVSVQLTREAYNITVWLNAVPNGHSTLLISTKLLVLVLNFVSPRKNHLGAK